ncbi:hypothetical protein LTR53_015739, partial [Teratosphaeriaceae sp. CCFEE 6253]
AEAKKMRVKLAKAAEGVKEQEKMIQGLGEGVPEEIRKKEEGYLRDAVGERRAYEEALARFEGMTVQ